MTDVHLLIDEAVAEIRLDNPAKMNALDVAMIRRIAEHCEAIEADAGILAVILTSEGDRAFCTGADIKAWGDIPAGDFARHWVREGHRVFDRLARLAKPTIAALQGPAFGGGLELAATCDIRILAAGASIALPEAGVGIVPGWSGTQRLLRLLPEPVVKEMALFGRRLPAERALALGFAAEIAQDPRARAREIAEGLAALSPRSVEVAKWMIHAAVDEDRAATVEALGAGMVGAFDDRAEGVAAFREKRKPVFPGT
jgi:enoyl-CoA hydratase/carnithine racemase